MADFMKTYFLIYGVACMGFWILPSHIIGNFFEMDRALAGLHEMALLIASLICFGFVGVISAIQKNK